jgi:hypothetical protein
LALAIFSSKRLNQPILRVGGSLAAAGAWLFPVFSDLIRCCLGSGIDPV